MKKNKAFNGQQGASMIETLLVFPVMFLIGMGIIHLGLVYQAKSNLEYAALMAARIGSVTSIDIGRMRDEAAKRMAPTQIGTHVITRDDIVIDIINPSWQMIRDCGVVPLDDSVCGSIGNACELPNFGLQYRPTTKVCGGASIQDANILRIKVTYRFDSKIPFMNMRLFPGDNRNITGNGIDVSAIATVRMQTPARITTENEAYF